ncbi:MAG: ABC transporter substrate-binding protein [Firmicutes bacterium]|nr:ABC transporter substrate-binding protein [Bacillota bacterium]MBQ6214758.1 ABC transporter substrate-binding protein [Oscillospiraceae bacterium]
MKKAFALVLALCMVFALCACGASSAKAEESYTVGVCQLVQHPALDAATEGFQAALKDKLGDKVKVDVQNASGDSPTCSVIVNQFVSDQVDLIMANATPALLAAQSATGEIPILGTSITDYASALGIEDWNGATGLNISGTSDLAPLDGQAEMLKELFPDAHRVGVLYCSAEPNSKYQADKIDQILADLGYIVTEYTFADSNDVASVTATAVGENDVLYIPTDNTAASCTEAINNVALPAGVPIICGEENLCKGCGLATLSINYYDLGYATGEMAYEVLVNGADVSTMAIQFAPVFTKEYNAANAEALGISVPSDYVAIAD